MSKSLSSIKDHQEKMATIDRRIRSDTKGLGYWAAIDAKKYLGEIKRVKKEETEE